MKTYIPITILSVAVVCGSTAYSKNADDNPVASEANRTVVELLDEIAQHDKVLAQKDRDIAKLKAAYDELNARFKKQAEELKSVKRSDALEAALADKKKALGQRDAALRARDNALAQRDEAQKKYDDLVLSTSRNISELKEKLKEVQVRLEKSEKSLACKDDEISRLQAKLVIGNESLQQDRFTLAYNLGCIYKAAKQYEKAEQEFLKAESINPNDSNVHYNLGILYDDNLKDPKKARKHYELFLDLAPNDEDAQSVKQWLKEL